MCVAKITQRAPLLGIGHGPLTIHTTYIPREHACMHGLPRAKTANLDLSHTRSEYDYPHHRETTPRTPFSLHWLEFLFLRRVLPPIPKTDSRPTGRTGTWPFRARVVEIELVDSLLDPSGTGGGGGGGGVVTCSESQPQRNDIARSAQNAATAEG